ncbi:MAG: YggS family pyridoxal phosphate-dependent enzyme [Anaerolineales bacterium]|nr:YggS family pyridoxal phosphate-dependent enzyme [Anaerolineales bacterium]
MDTLTTRYEQVLQRITKAAQHAGRNPANITLVSVTKTWPAETVLAAYEVGMRHFGENRPEELGEKRPFIESTLGTDNGITWHLIGTLQSRKTRLAAEHADVFHALDRSKIAARLSEQAGDFQRRLPIFLEVNVSGEMSKSGFSAHNWENDATQQAKLRTMVQAVMDMPHLELVGLMTMAPWDVPENEIRTVFRRTRELAGWLETAVSGLTLPYLSMGMTDDFEIAIAEGATHVRVGRAIFGSRHT